MLGIGTKGTDDMGLPCFLLNCHLSFLFRLQMYFGVCVTILVTASWVGATHCIKFLYVYQNASQYAATTPSLISTNENFFYGDFENETNQLFQPIHIPTILPKNPSSSLSSPQSSSISSTASAKQYAESKFHAPFFAAWFCTNFMLLFFPIYLLGRLALSNCSETPGEILGNIIRGFRDRGFTAGRFLNRCIVFCLLWLITTHLYILSLRALLSTDAMSLFATNVASSYLLSWVILHEQFVGVRVSLHYFCIFARKICSLSFLFGIPDCCSYFGKNYLLKHCRIVECRSRRNTNILF